MIVKSFLRYRITAGDCFWKGSTKTYVRVTRDSRLVFKDYSQAMFNRGLKQYK